MGIKAWQNWSKLLIVLFATGFFIMGAAPTRAETQFSADVKKALIDMKSEAAKLGEPKVDGTQLFFGGTKINGNYELVDALKTKYNCTATFFVKKADGFVRISTNVMKDGNRAIGTLLDPNGKAIVAIRKGEAFYGVVDILGKQYDTGYEPIKSASGEVIGIYYVGYPL